MSYKGGHGGKVESIEGKIVQDADRLDSLGAIGIGSHICVWRGEREINV